MTRGSGLIAALIVACTSSPPPPDVSTVGLDGGMAFDFDAFALEVAAAASASGSTRNCATALPARGAGDVAAARSVVSEAVARNESVTPAQLQRDQTPCGPPNLDCASWFQHHVYKGDGRMGNALLPSARVVDRESSSVDLAVWTATRDGVSVGTAVSLHGLRDGRILGLVFFFDIERCAP